MSDSELGQSVLKSALGGEFSSADDVAVPDRRQLVGLVPIERRLATPSEAPMPEIMDADPPLVDPGCDQEAVASKMVEHGESSPFEEHLREVLLT